MFNCKMIINRLHIEDTRMEIGVAINCPFDVDVSSPKARILFECDGQTRRLPLRVVNYFRQKQEGSCIVVCNYTYLLDYSFSLLTPPVSALQSYYPISSDITSTDELQLVLPKTRFSNPKNLHY